MFSQNLKRPIVKESGGGDFPHLVVVNSIVKGLDELKTPYIELQRVCSY
jgi:hypothetical protein